MPRTSSTYQPIFLAQGNPKNSVELLSGVPQLLALPGSAPALDLIQVFLCLPGLCSRRYMAIKWWIFKTVEITSHAGKFLYQGHLFLPRGSFILIAILSLYTIISSRPKEMVDLGSNAARHFLFASCWALLARSLKSVLVLLPQIFGPFGPPKKRVNFNKINQRHKCVIFLSPICSLNIFCPSSCLSS